MLQRRERVSTLLSGWTKVVHLPDPDHHHQATAQFSDVERSFSVLKKVMSIPRDSKGNHCYIGWSKISGRNQTNELAVGVQVVAGGEMGEVGLLDFTQFHSTAPSIFRQTVNLNDLVRETLSNADKTHPVVQTVNLTEKSIVVNFSLDCVDLELPDGVWTWCLCDLADGCNQHPYLQPPTPHLPNSSFSHQNEGSTTTIAASSDGPVFYVTVLPSTESGLLSRTSIVGGITVTILLVVVFLIGSIYWYKRYVRLRRLKIDALASTNAPWSSQSYSPRTKNSYESHIMTPDGSYYPSDEDYRISTAIMSERSSSEINIPTLAPDFIDDNIRRKNTVANHQGALLRYKDFEIPREDLDIFHDRLLGSGAFGKVLYGHLHRTSREPVLITAENLHQTVPNSNCYAQPQSNQGVGKTVTIEVAVKTLLPTALDSAQTEFLQEIKLLRQLGTHPHLVNPIGAITNPTTGPLSLVVEYCNSGDLLRLLRSKRTAIRNSQLDPLTQKLMRGAGCFPALSQIETNQSAEQPERTESDLAPSRENKLNQNQPFALHQLLSFAWQISDGMEFISEKGFVHRDLAARNIMVQNGRLAKVGDFGLCRYIYSSTNAYLSKGGRLPLKWMSVEAIRDSEFSWSSDVWSFGIVCYELLTFGASPYPMIHPCNLLEYLESDRRLPPPEYQAAGIGCPAELYALMLWCWDGNPDRRPSFARLKHELGRMLEENMLACSSSDATDADSAYVQLNYAELDFEHHRTSTEQLPSFAPIPNSVSAGEDDPLNSFPDEKDLLRNRINGTDLLPHNRDLANGDASSIQSRKSRMEVEKAERIPPTRANSVDSSIASHGISISSSDEVSLNSANSRTTTLPPKSHRRIQQQMSIVINRSPAFPSGNDSPEKVIGPSEQNDIV